MAVTGLIELLDCKIIYYSRSINPLITRQNERIYKALKGAFEIVELKVG